MSFLSSLVFRKIFLSHLLLSLILVICAGFWSDHIYRERMMRDLQSQLTTDVLLLSAQFPDDLSHQDRHVLRGFAEHLGGVSSARLTLILADGTVIADSENSVQRMENHKDRPEVLEAFARGTGESIRYSQTLGMKMAYFARIIPGASSPRGILRMSIPEKRLHEGFARLRGILIWIFVSGVVYSFAAAWILSRITLESGRTMVRKASDLMRQELAGSHLASEKEKEELTLALSGLMGGVVTLDSRDRLVFWNEAVGRFLEWSATPNKGAHISDVVRVSALFEMVDQVRENGIGIAREISIWRKGTERVMNVHILPCKLIEGSGIMIVLNDNTSLRFLERTRQEFVANASHELKTPLTAIKGYVDSLKDGGDADPGIRKKFLDQLSHNVDRLVALADDLLSLSRIEEADETLRLDRVNLLNLVNRVVERHRPLSENKGVGISTAVQPSADWEISSHSESLQQVLDNLIENAIKYTNPGGRVSVGLKRNENEVQILVSDTGIGIPKSDFERIFERFYRVDKSRSLEVGGTGLGLSIVKHLLVKLNGSVNVESELGRGSQFTMHLPIIS